MALDLPPDPRSLTALYADHHSWLLGRLLSRLGHREDAEDLAAETFAQIAARVDSGNLQEPRAYLTVIARRLLFHFWRRRDLERAYLQYLATLPEALAPSAEDRLLVLEALGEIDRRLDGLPERVRRVFLMSQLEALSYEQIAAKTGISVRTVGRHMREAMLHCCRASAP